MTLRDYDRLTPKERQQRHDATVCGGCFHQRGMHVQAKDSACAAMCKLCDCYCDCCGPKLAEGDSGTAAHQINVCASAVSSKIVTVPAGVFDEAERAYLAGES